MSSLPLTLDAALRDASSPDPQARGQAVRCLAPALLAELGDPAPRLHLAAGHARGPDVVAALTRAAADPDVGVRAIAATGLGQLGEPAVLPLVDPWLADPAAHPDAGYLRECAAITLVLLGLAARPSDLSRTPGASTALSQAPGKPARPFDPSRTPGEPDRPPAPSDLSRTPGEPDRPPAPSDLSHTPGPAASAPPRAPVEPAPSDLSHAPSDPAALARATWDAALARISAALRSPADDLRFQAAGGLVELAGRAAEAPLCDALRTESHPRVRAALVAALAELDPPGPDACALLAPLAEDPRAPLELAFPAALGLAAARDPRGAPRLLDALRRPDDRARALEAFAVLGPAAPPAAVRAADKIARGWLVSAVMRVRAAYALARMSPETGLPLLDALARKTSPAVQDAVADARAALAALAARDPSH